MNQCLDPEGDDDGDSLINRLEVDLGSNPFEADTDRDGLLDGAEIVGLANVDTDGDGLADIVESASDDADGDCITDQFDAQNDVANSDLSPMRDQVCSALGVCADVPRDQFAVSCATGVAVCDYANVPGYAAPEALCDGLDDNCDGAADEGFDDQDADGIADCVDVDFDNDGVVDLQDNCPQTDNAGQDDGEGDGIGDACAADYLLVFMAAPTEVTAGAPFDVSVALQDRDGATVTRFTGDVSLSLRAAGQDIPLVGTITVGAVAGVATFTGLAVAGPNAGATLSASSGADGASGGLGVATSDAFDVIASELEQLEVTGAPATVVAGSPLSLTLTAYDPQDNVLQTYAGSVLFQSTDPAATLPSPYSWQASDAGSRLFEGLILETAGAQTISIVDVVTAETLATFEVSVVNAPARGFVVSGLPDPLTAGASTELVVSVVDAYGNLALDYVGSARFTSDDPAADLPVERTFAAADGGELTVNSLVFKTAGARTLTVADSGNEGLGGSATTLVIHGPAAAMTLTELPSAVVAGQATSFTATVRDAFGNRATGFVGVANLSTTDPQVASSDLDFEAIHAGARALSVTLLSSGSRQITVNAGEGLSASGSTVVGAASASIFAVSNLPSTVVAGDGLPLTISVKDAYGNPAAGAAGAFSTSSSDGAAAIDPAAITLSGVSSATVGLILKTAGAQVVSVTHPSLSGDGSQDITVNPADPAALTTSALPSTTTAGTSRSVMVRVIDAYGNTVRGYAGAVAISDDDANTPTYPGFSFGAGLAQATVSVTFTQAGTRTLTLSDPMLPAGGRLVTTSTSVGPAAASSLEATPSATISATAGVPFDFTITLYDAYANVATGYEGTVAFSSLSDGTFDLPAAYAFTAGDAGTRQFQVTAYSAFPLSIDVSGGGLPGGTGSDTISASVSPAALDHLVVAGPVSDPGAGDGFTITISPYDAHNNLIATSESVTIAYSRPMAGGATSQVLKLSGATASAILSSTKSGEVTFMVTSDDDDGISDAVTVTIAPGPPDYLAFTQQPVAGDAGYALGTVGLALFDEFDNIAPAPGAQISVGIARNASQGQLSASALTKSAATGAVSFSDLVIDKAGIGYALGATSTLDLGGALSARFSVSWRAPSIVGTPTVSGAAGCVAVDYVVAHGRGAAVDVLVEARDGVTGPWRRAVQAPSPDGSGSGTGGLASSAEGIGHRYLLDSDSTFGHVNTTAASLRLTPSVGGVSGPSVVVSGVDLDNGWTAGVAATVGFGSGPNARDFAVADFDRNGLPDVAITRGGSNVAMTLLFQKEPGSWSEESPALDLGFTDPVAMDVAQLGEEIGPDLFVLTDNNTRLVILRAIVDGATNLRWNFSSVEACRDSKSDLPVDVASARLTTNTQAAVVLCDGSPPTLSIVSEPSGQQPSWHRSGDTIIPSLGYYAMDTADLGRDGDSDVVASHKSGVAVFDNVAGNFCAPGECASKSIPIVGGSRYVVVGDLNKDGLPDIVSANGSKTVTILRGVQNVDVQGVISDYFAGETAYKISGNLGADVVSIGDVNSDGEMDIIVGSAGDDAVAIFAGDGRFGFTELHERATGASSRGAVAMAVVDMDRDGRADVVVGRGDLSAGTRGVFILDGAPQSSCAPFVGASDLAPAQLQATFGRSVDVDLDGRADMVWLNGPEARSDGFDVAFGDGAGGFQLGVGGWHEGDLIRLGAFGDLNGDGFMDAALRDDEAGAVYVVTQSPTDNSFELSDAFQVNDTPTSIAIGDLDNDGIGDIAWIGGAGLHVAYMDATGSGVPKAGLVTLPAVQGPTGGLALSDLNKDGTLDFVFYLSDGRLCSHLSTGPRSWPVVVDESLCEPFGFRLGGEGEPLGVGGPLQLRDLDGDGVDSLLALEKRGDFNADALVIFDSSTPDSGSFDLSQSLAICDGSGDLAFGDFNDDALIDIAIACGRGYSTGDNPVWLLHQDPGGGFSALGAKPDTLGPIVYGASSLAVGDMNGDRRDDVVAVDGVIPQRPSGGGFALAAELDLANSVSGMLHADLDRDGRDDLVTWANSTVSVYLRTGPTTLGAPTSYDMGSGTIYDVSLLPAVVDGWPNLVIGFRRASGEAQNVLRFLLGNGTPGAFTLLEFNYSVGGVPNHVAAPWVGDGVGAYFISHSSPYSAVASFDFLMGGDNYSGAGPGFPTNVVDIAVGRFGAAFGGTVNYQRPALGGLCAGVPCVVIADYRAAGGSIAVIPAASLPALTLTAPGYNSIGGMAVGDLNNDGHDDVVLQVRSSTTNQTDFIIFTQDAADPGSFFPAETVAGLQARAQGVRLADINGDGRLDIVGAMGRNQELPSLAGFMVLLQESGPGAAVDFVPGATLPTALLASSGSAFDLLDFDSDGRLDLLVYDSSVRRLKLLAQP